LTHRAAKYQNRDSNEMVISIASAGCSRRSPPSSVDTQIMAGLAPTSKTKKVTAKTTGTKTLRVELPCAGQGDAKKHASDVVRLLRHHYPDATCSLDFHAPLELLVATILSAQCTDERVNTVTQHLFRKYRSAADYARAPIAELEKDIQSTGFFRSKAKSIQNCCRLLAEQYHGQVPRNIDQLVELPGIGRKTANVILGTAFGIASGVVVDTHVTRLSHRLGLSQQKAAEKIEKDLMAIIPSQEWVAFSHRMIQHGRKVCVARKPKCDVCPIRVICPKLGVEPT
jgi:endonuclease-3